MCVSQYDMHATAPLPPLTPPSGAVAAPHTTYALPGFGSPDGHWLSQARVAQMGKDTRGTSDVFGFAAALGELLVKITENNDDGSVKEKFYDALKLALDVAVYWPQGSYSLWSGWHQKAGFHDGYIGICGLGAAVVGGRQMWKKIAP